MKRHSSLFWVLVTLYCILSQYTTTQAAIVGSGDVSPFNLATWTSSNTGYIGLSSIGTVIVNGGSGLTSSACYLGYNVGSTGTVTITGAGSYMTNYGLTIGYSGNGTLHVEAGGQVNNMNYGYLGYNSGSAGVVTVTGPGSRFGNGYDLFIGYFGSGTLTVADGGLVTVNKTLWAPLSSLLGDGRITAKGAVLDGDFVLNSTSPQSISFGSGGTLTLTLDGSGNLGAGYKGAGTLQITDGIAVASSYGYLGYNSGSTGTATVSGPGSKWTNGYDFYVGNSGSGTLTVIDGGVVNVGGTLYAPLTSLFGNGTITAKGAVLDADLIFDSTHGIQQTIAFGTGGILNLNQNASKNLGAGYKGNGTLTITDGLSVASSAGYLGYSSGSTGTATVTGTGSKWTNSSGLCVGYSGSGNLDIELGGQVSNTYGYLGYDFGSVGKATVSGIGSMWTNSNDLYVGRLGSGTLTVADGGIVTVAGTLYAPLNSLSGNGTISANGAVMDANLIFDGTHGLQQAIAFGLGGTLNLNQKADMNLGVGYKDNGTLRIADGASVASYRGYLGYNPGSMGTANVTDVGSRWNNSDYLYIGYSGSGTLNIDGSGQVNDTSGYLGYNPSSTGTVTVAGSGTKWTNSGSLFVGQSGSGTLTIVAGGQVSNTSGYLGNNTDSTGTATITGTGSLWTNSGNLYVGNVGRGTLTVADGGMVTAGTLYASINDLFGDGFITTKGALLDANIVFDSSHGTQPSLVFGTSGVLKLNMNGSAILGAGYKGTGTITIADGITVASSYGHLGFNSGSTGRATVSGTGSQWTLNGDFNVGCSGSGTLNIAAGGRVSNTSNSSASYIGNNAGSVGNATVSGAGSTWLNSFALFVGNSGSGTLNIESGGRVTNNDGFLGNLLGSTGMATISDTGSLWTNNTRLYVGNWGTGTLNIKAGGQVTNANFGYIGNHFGVVGNATVTGAGSKWISGNSLYIGYSGIGNLDVEVGGEVNSASNAYLGYSSNSVGSVTIDGVASKWTNSGSLYVGNSGSGAMDIRSGGTVSNTVCFLGYNSGATGDVTIAGSASKWTNSSALYVGYAGNGTLRIESAAQTSSTGAYLGYNAGSVGSVAVVGAGSIWTNTGDLYIGKSGNGYLTVTDGGSVSVTRTLYASLADLAGNGVISTKGAVLDASINFDGTSQPTISFGTGGTLNLSLEKSNNLGVGYKGYGELRFANGIEARSSYGYLGYNLGSTGIATISGTRSKWTTDEDIYIGYSGSGSLNIEASGWVSSYNSYIGYNVGSVGAVTVSGTGSEWYIQSSYLWVGYSGSGTLRIEAGGQVYSSWNGVSYLGYNTGSKGMVTVTGSASKWVVGNAIYVGNLGSGSLTIEQGGQVSSSGGYLGYGAGTAGVVTITGAASKWTNSGVLFVGNLGNGIMTVNDGASVTTDTLYSSLSSLSGNGNITTSGAVLDASLNFVGVNQQTLSFGSGGRLVINVNLASHCDLGVGYKETGTLKIGNGTAIASSNGYLGYHPGSLGTATITGIGSSWAIDSKLYVGNSGIGMLTIEGGAIVSDSFAYLGNNSGSIGTATIIGPGSNWTSPGGLTVGASGNGKLTIEAGGQVNSWGGSIGSNSNSLGTAIISGAGSKWTMGDHGSLYVGHDGRGVLTIRAGGQVSDTYGFLGHGVGSGVVTVTGSGSLWTNSSSLNIGDSYTKSSSLSILDGGAVTAASIYIENKSLLAIDVGAGSKLSIGGSSGTITNNGTVRILAGANSVTNAAYTPISASTWSGTGAYQAIGGKWNAASHIFTVSSVQAGHSGTAVTIDRLITQRVLIDDSSNPWILGTSFASAATSAPLSFTATTITDGRLDGLKSLIPGQIIEGAWNFAASGNGYTVGDPVYLSFDAGAGHSQSDLNIWHFDGSAWTPFTANDLTYDGRYASFTVTSFSGYAVSAVPEPGTLFLLLLGITGMAVITGRKLPA